MTQTSRLPPGGQVFRPDGDRWPWLAALHSSLMSILSQYYYGNCWSNNYNKTFKVNGCFTSIIINIHYLMQTSTTLRHSAHAVDEKIRTEETKCLSSGHTVNDGLGLNTHTNNMLYASHYPQPNIVSAQLMSRGREEQSEPPQPSYLLL